MKFVQNSFLMQFFWYSDIPIFNIFRRPCIFFFKNPWSSWKKKELLDTLLWQHQDPCSEVFLISCKVFQGGPRCSKVFLISWTIGSWVVSTIGSWAARFDSLAWLANHAQDIKFQSKNLSWYETIMKSRYILPVCVPCGETTPPMLVTTKRGCVRGRKPHYKEVVMWGSCGRRQTTPYRHTWTIRLGGHTFPKPYHMRQYNNPI